MLAKVRMVVTHLKIKKIFRLLVGLICGAFFIQILLFEQFNSNLTADVPNTNIEKIIFDIQLNGSSNVIPLNEFDEKYVYRINPAKSICETFNCDSLQIIFIVKSHVLNFGQRVAIRRTWGGKTILRSKTVFIVGYLDGIDHLIQLESNNYKDIVQLNLPDQYENLVYKTIYSILWLLHVDVEVEFIHFVDDDRLVNPMNIYDFAKHNIFSADLVMIGYKLDLSKPNRNKNSKTYISPDDYQFTYYPPYIIGGTILTNIKTVRILAIAVAFIKVIPIEDVYIGIVAMMANIKLKHHFRFLPYKESPSNLRNTASSPGYASTYILLRDWNLVMATDNIINK
ncbi:beta-1,3-galactosyltransferase brn-like [Mytilus californianus]|uniref:beta-1,3-galactosyltransferase brn-like n=1 Tax=Mytilus californianus TaxID=6549 RepID=UPI0022459DE8|nr:beta-1,3-galactosyltransferase brn-like [Mytilus californianus]XP_052085765.1 beta-1,3-galactosyltransferase brn-like [Mytilus californianus]